MIQHVNLKVGQLPKTFVTFCVAVWFSSSMNHCVNLNVVQLPKRLVTFCAALQFNPSVN